MIKHAASFVRLTAKSSPKTETLSLFGGIWKVSNRLYLFVTRYHLYDPLQTDDLAFFLAHCRLTETAGEERRSQFACS